MSNSGVTTESGGRQNMFPSETKPYIDESVSYEGYPQNAEKVNGRWAMIGFVALLGAYVITGQIIPGKIEGTNFSDSLLIGHSTTGSLSSAEDNTGVGIEALDALTSGDQNTAVGNVALTALTSSGKNTGVGAFALNVVTDSTGFNSAFGRSALQLVTGSYNTGVGAGAGENITSGSGNVIIGKVLADSATGNRQLKISGYDGSQPQHGFQEIILET